MISYPDKWYSGLNGKYLKVSYAISTILIIIIAIFREKIIGFFDKISYTESISENITKLFYVPLILIAGIIIYKELSKRKDISKLKSGETPSLEIVGTVKEIIYLVSDSKHDNNRIRGWYITAEGVNPLTNKQNIYKSEEYPYDISKERGIRRFGPSKEDIEEFYKYVNQYIKIGDPIKIITSLENPKIYYFEEPIANH